jgi:hypothetical protein
LLAHLETISFLGEKHLRHVPFHQNQSKPEFSRPSFRAWKQCFLNDMISPCLSLCFMEKHERRGVQELGEESYPSSHCGWRCGGVQDALPSVESTKRGRRRRACLGSKRVDFFPLFWSVWCPMCSFGIISCKYFSLL